MIGLAGAKRRQPPTPKRKTTTQEIKAARQVAMAQLRAEAMSARAVELALLAADYAQKLAAAQGRYSGDELAAAITAIMAEQRAAERALSKRHSGSAKERRKAVGAQFAERIQGEVKQAFRSAAVETARRSDGPSRGRPRDRDRVGRSPRLRR